MQGDFHRACAMQSRKQELITRSFALAHAQFVQCLEPVNQLHKDAVRVFFAEGRTVFDKSNPASLAVLVSKSDSVTSLHKLFRCCVQNTKYIGVWHDTQCPRFPATADDNYTHSVALLHAYANCVLGVKGTPCNVFRCLQSTSLVESWNRSVILLQNTATGQDRHVQRVHCLFGLKI